MAISAGSALCGKVKSVEHGAVNFEVIVELTGGQEVVAIINKSSAEWFGLSPGNDVEAVVKASNVMISA